ncbi:MULTISPECIES: hypothetical protein [unclassified Crossiella]|uniref:hypothetical protein n=1 Tax=unclassified Crossiella TaxID=2620835 RepID=UPI0020000E21|nr:MULTISPECIES: hypothetical protein [unclassified Crossiella]MCK2239990.1 hypothetical protein [Crossiella sp. S99.2]MCK2252698.1 hypothetical protein [Crossiella sp. S99.1]
MRLDQFDADDFEVLRELYDAPTSGSGPGKRRARHPWNRRALTEREADAQDRLSRTFAVHYNRRWAQSVRELIPPCWPEHDELTDELDTLCWTWYYAHWDERANALTPAEFRLRYLPGFRSRLPRLLGPNGLLCQEGKHPVGWRRVVEAQIQVLEAIGRDRGAAKAARIRLREQDFGFGVE